MSALEEEIAERLKKLRPEQREQVLEYTRSLGKKPLQGTPSEALRPFLGIWSAEEADEIERYIKETCERVDADEW
ncbi:MAG TPA: hypothetical protein VF092_10410 [Longimicrobium sp.]